MYLHIGGETEVFAGKIICILNYGSTSNIGVILNFSDYEITDLSSGKASSVVLIKDFDGKFLVYLSPISTETLKKRMECGNRIISD